MKVDECNMHFIHNIYFDHSFLFIYYYYYCFVGFDLCGMEMEMESRALLFGDVFCFCFFQVSFFLIIIKYGL